MGPDERISHFLCTKLFRSENRDVVEAVAAQLHEEIDKYVRRIAFASLPVEDQPIPLETATTDEIGKAFHEESVTFSKWS
jgi:hypothetical protein